jgi:NAD(P)-dependent dehydrogenase (short-subunit alcohol dehydrogenase family)
VTDVAIVTGAAGGLGRAICARLAADGLTIAAADVITPEDPGNYAWLELDVRSTESIEAAVRAASELGRLRAVVNSHGILHFTDPADFSDDVMRAIIDVNLEGVARMCSIASRYLQADGSIVSLSSVVAGMGRAKGAFVYGATKAGIESLTRYFAVAFGPKGIRVNAVAPGFVTLPMSGDGAKMRAVQGGDEAVLQFSPMGRLVTPEEIANAVAFLSSPQASGISGAVIPVDVGQRAL